MLNEILLSGIIVSLCLLLHVAGLLVMAEWSLQRRQYLEQRGRIHYAVFMVLIFAGIIFLHTFETSIWAAFYYTRALFNDFETSLYFSLTSYTTIGYGDVVLPQKWRLLGAIEGISGVLLCGMSTAFIFAVMSAMFQFRLQHETRLSEVTVTSGR
jgi:ion channel